MKKEIMWHNDGTFISPFPRQYEIAQYLQKQYPQWMTCEDIASNLYGVSSKEVCDLLSELLSSPGGQDAVEVCIDEQSHINKYRFNPD